MQYAYIFKCSDFQRLTWASLCCTVYILQRCCL